MSMDSSDYCSLWSYASIASCRWEVRPCTEDMLEVIHGKKREDILLPNIPEAAEIISWQERVERRSAMLVPDVHSKAGLF
jgi:hypothetical protein